MPWGGRGFLRRPGSRLAGVQVHLVLLIAWVVLLAPTLLWWGNSIRWVLVISIYANIASHWSAWEAKRAAGYAKDQAGAGDAPPV